MQQKLLKKQSDIIKLSEEIFSPDKKHSIDKEKIDKHNLILDYDGQIIDNIPSDIWRNISISNDNAYVYDKEREGG